MKTDQTTGWAIQSHAEKISVLAGYACVLLGIVHGLTEYLLFGIAFPASLASAAMLLVAGLLFFVLRGLNKARAAVHFLTAGVWLIIVFAALFQNGLNND